MTWLPEGWAHMLRARVGPPTLQLGAGAAIMTWEQGAEDLQRHADERVTHDSSNSVVLDDAETVPIGYVSAGAIPDDDRDAEFCWCGRDEYVGKEVRPFVPPCIEIDGPAAAPVGAGASGAGG